jgi:hypothetical protein
MHATGAHELFEELIARKLVDAQDVLEAVKVGKGLYCWPPIEQTSEKRKD